MESHFFSAMSQWFMYCLPITVAWLRLRMGKQLPLSFGANCSHQSVACLDRCRMDLVNAQRIRFDPGALGCD